MGCGVSREGFSTGFSKRCLRSEGDWGGGDNKKTGKNRKAPPAITFDKGGLTLVLRRKADGTRSGRREKRVLGRSLNGLVEPVVLSGSEGGRNWAKNGGGIQKGKTK